MLVNAAVTDAHLHASRWMWVCRRLFLHTSPEYAMKRLLAAGGGDIYQICHVARGFEQSRMHNSEFTLVEWYRLGFDLPQLMDEVEALLRELCADHPACGSRQCGSPIARPSSSTPGLIPLRPPCRSCRARSPTSPTRLASPAREMSCWTSSWAQ